MKRQAAHENKYLWVLFHKEFIYRIYKISQNLKPYKSIRKWASNLTLHQRRYMDSKKHLKRYSPSAVIKEMQIKTETRYCYTHYIMAKKLKKKTNCAKCWWECGGTGESHIPPPGNAKTTVYLENNLAVFTT